MLHLLFGDTVLAVSTVLAAYMGGLALGSFWSGRVVDRRARVLPLYALLEVGIAGSAVLLPVVLDMLQPLYVWTYRQLHEQFWLFTAARVALAFALLCVPTTLMGATLPVLSRYVVRSTATLGWKVGTLYALNTGGAVVGCFAAGYVLLGRYGLTRTVWIGAALNLAIALVVWVGRRWEPAVAGTTADHPRAAAGEPGVGAAGAPALDHGTVRVVLWCFAGSGFAALSYEVVWARALTFFIGNSTYAFSAMLTTFLCGLALGSLLGARAADRRPRPAAAARRPAGGDRRLRTGEHRHPRPAVLWARRLVGRLHERLLGHAALAHVRQDLRGHPPADRRHGGSLPAGEQGRRPRALGRRARGRDRLRRQHAGRDRRLPGQRASRRFPSWACTAAWPSRRSRAWGSAACS